MSDLRILSDFIFLVVNANDKMTGVCICEICLYLCATDV